MKFKIIGTPDTRALEALVPHSSALYATPGKRIVIVAELAAVERTQIAPDEEGRKPSVTLQIKECEVAAAEQEDAVRQTMKALNLHRTAYGTLTEDLDVELSAETISRCAGDVTQIEAARLHTGADYWGSYAQHASRSAKTVTELRRELANVGQALHALIYPSARKTESA